MAAIDLGEFDALTFDCYGTLIDWERGITETLAPVLARVEHTPDDRLLEAYARHEAALETGSYLPYREVVSRAMAGVCAEHGVEATAADRGMFGASVGEWPPFDDSVDALRRLSSRYRLGAITNCDDDLFARSAERLDVEFDWVVSAQQAGAYKPNAAMFLLAEILIVRFHFDDLGSRLTSLVDIPLEAIEMALGDDRGIVGIVLDRRKHRLHGALRRADKLGYFVFWNKDIVWRQADLAGV